MKYSKDKIMSHLYKCEDSTYDKAISGWWKDSVFEIYEAFDLLQKKQNIEGNLCEIGTWFGRSFLPLRNFTEDDEVCIGIDIFRNNTPNYYDALLDNIKKCFGSLDRCKIIPVTKDSTVSDKHEAIKPYAPIRLFYIDGDHSYAGALLDLNVAKLSLHQDGIMFLDDYENPNYGPAVTKAVNTFLEENKEFVLAFSSSQRVFLCRTHMVDSYVSAMSELNWNVGKDIVWSDLVNFEHPHGYNSWQAIQLLEK